MLDLLSIFGKGGIVLWCWQGTQELLTPSVNALIRNVFLQERGNTSVYQHNGLTLKFKLDNEFDLVFLVAYSNAVQLSYTDKLLGDVEREFRDRYRNILQDPQLLLPLCSSDHFNSFEKDFRKIWKHAEEGSKMAPKRDMKAWNETEKSQKTVASMITKKGAEPKDGKKKPKQPTAPSKATPVAEEESEPEPEEPEEEEEVAEEEAGGLGEPSEAELMEMKRLEFMRKKMGGPKKTMSKTPKSPPAPAKKGKPGKQGTKWGEALSKDEIQNLDYTAKNTTTNGKEKEDTYDYNMVGSMKGNVPDLDEGVHVADDDESEEEDAPAAKTKSSSGGGFFSAFSNLVGGNKKLTAADIEPAMDRMKDNLIAKNVAAEIAEKFCDSVGTQLEGKVISSWKGVKAVVNETVRDSLMTILQPRRRIDILRDIQEARSQKRPYTIAFCGVNGVGKSTNLAKITFWLIENKCRVMIAAGDTFRAGAVEQLRTHVRHLNALHPDSTHLYDQGYGKDAADVAKYAINLAKKEGMDVVLIDTAGRMQDNEPLMRALAKLIRENQPDLVLFVGEALVGNEAVDQLVKFNQALADHSDSEDPRLIDGILLTKFDTIDDKVGAAISMTYITGQPIVFVGTGQTYRDLKNLNATAVVNALLK